MKSKIQNIKTMILNNKKVVENYFFMTILVILNSAFALLIYPYAIRILGKESYGTYVFITTIINYFLCFVGFGFDMYGVRKIAENINSITIKSEVFSGILTAKLLLELASILISLLILYTTPFFENYHSIYWVCFLSTFANILFPIWYFQAIQKMKVVTYVQLFFKIISLPFIFYYVRETDDLFIFALIMTVSTLVGSLFAFLYVLIIEKIAIKILPFSNIFVYIKGAQYFFYANFWNVVKNYSLNLIIGAKFGMGDLAVYDLATKIVQIPMMLVTSINGALFPKIVMDFNIYTLKRIMKIEKLIGIVSIISVIILGKIVTKILGGSGMEQAYFIAVILSFTIYIFLQTGCNTSLIFAPLKMDTTILNNQIIAFASLIIYMLVGFSLIAHIWVLPISLVLSAFTELIYQNSIIKQKKIFN